MFRVWSLRPGIAVSPLADFTPSPISKHPKFQYEINFQMSAFWAVIWGGAKRMGGGRRTRERALPKIFGPLQKSFWSALSWIFAQAKQSTDT